MTIKKVCFLIPSVSAGGIETYLLRFLKYSDSKFDVTVVVRNTQRGELYDNYLETGAKLIFKPLGYFSFLRIYDYFRFFKSQSFDVVCDFNANFAGLPLWIAKCAKIESRIAFYRQGRNHYKASVFKELYNKWANNLVFHSATTILSNSKSALDYFFSYRMIDDNRFQVIRNGMKVEDFDIEVDKLKLRQELCIPENAFVIGHCGRLDEAKNHETILKVAHKLIALDGDCFFVFCGKDTENLQIKVDELTLTNNVRILGYRSDVNRLLKIFDVFYFPSLTEGQPNALIEAMLLSVPFIASNIPPIIETVPIQLHEWLLEPSDAQQAIELILDFKKNYLDIHSRILCQKDSLIEQYSAEINFKDFNKIIMRP